MPDWVAARRDRRQTQVAHALERIRVELRGRPALARPLVEVRELMEQDDRLDRVEAGGVALESAAVLLHLAVVPERAGALGERSRRPSQALPHPPPAPRFLLG